MVCLFLCCYQMVMSNFCCLSLIPRLTILIFVVKLIYQPIASVFGDQGKNQYLTKYFFMTCTVVRQEFQ